MLRQNAQKTFLSTESFREPDKNDFYSSCCVFKMLEATSINILGSVCLASRITLIASPGAKDCFLKALNKQTDCLPLLPSIAL